MNPSTWLTCFFPLKISLSGYIWNLISFIIFVHIFCFLWSEIEPVLITKWQNLETKQRADACKTVIFVYEWTHFSDYSVSLGDLVCILSHFHYKRKWMLPNQSRGKVVQMISWMISYKWPATDHSNTELVSELLSTGYASLATHQNQPSAASAAVTVQLCADSNRWKPKLGPDDHFHKSWQLKCKHL